MDMDMHCTWSFKNFLIFPPLTYSSFLLPCFSPPSLFLSLSLVEKLVCRWSEYD